MNIEKLSLIGRKSYKYNDNITISIPTIKQIRGNNESDEQRFWSEINIFIQTPSDMISELDSVGIDFEKISDYDLFIFLFAMKKNESSHGLSFFDNLCLWDLEVVNYDNRIVLVDEFNNVIIDNEIYDDLSQIISIIIGHKKTQKKKFGNSFAKKKRIEQDYKKKERMRNRNKEECSNVLDGIILRLVCNSNFPYNFETIENVTIYDSIYSLKQIDKDIQVTDLLQSRLVGNDLSKLPNEQLSRFVL